MLCNHIINTGSKWSPLIVLVLRSSDIYFAAGLSTLLKHSSGQSFETIELLRDASIVEIQKVDDLTTAQQNTTKVDV